MLGTTEFARDKAMNKTQIACPFCETYKLVNK